MTKTRVLTSQKLRRAVSEFRFAGNPVHLLAACVDVNPNTLSSLIHGSLRIRSGDPRVVRLAQFLGVDPSDAFEEIEIADPRRPEKAL